MTLLDVQRWDMPDPPTPVVDDYCECGHSREMHHHSLGKDRWCRIGGCDCRKYDPA